MRIFIALFILTFTGSAFAKWAKVDEKSEKAVTPYGIKELLNGYEPLFEGIRNRAISKILVGEAPGELSEVEIITRTYHWGGSTVCPVNDPRLFYETLAYRACWEGSKGCESSAQMMIGRDPCL